MNDNQAAYEAMYLALQHYLQKAEQWGDSDLIEQIKLAFNELVRLY